MFLAHISKLISISFFTMPNSFLFSHFFCSLYISILKKKKILKFACSYICLNVFMNYIFQRVWSRLVIQILALHGFAQIHGCLVAVNGYFFSFFSGRAKYETNHCVPYWISLTNGLTNYFFFFPPQCSLICESTNVFPRRCSKCKSTEALWFLWCVAGCTDNI